MCENTGARRESEHVIRTGFIANVRHLFSARRVQLSKADPGFSERGFGQTSGYII